MPTWPLKLPESNEARVVGKVGRKEFVTSTVKFFPAAEQSQAEESFTSYTLS